MIAINFFLILMGVLLNAGAQLLLKAGTNSIGMIDSLKAINLDTVLKIIQEPHILGGLTCYVFSVGIWIVTLSRVEVSIAYPLLSIGYIVNAFAAYYLFNEAFTTQKMLGIGFIMVGVWILAKS